MHTFANGPLTFRVQDEGNGPPVLLLHGFPQDSRCWDEVAPLLHAAGLRTLRFDQRGYADTARPSRTRDYGSDRLVSDVVALLDEAGLEQVHLVGHDLGGLVGWAMAAAHPRRLASLTVLSVPHPRAFLWSLLTSTQAARSWYAAAFQVPGMAEQILAQPALVRRFLAVSHAPHRGGRARCRVAGRSGASTRDAAVVPGAPARPQLRLAGVQPGPDHVPVVGR